MAPTGTTPVDHSLTVAIHLPPAVASPARQHRTGCKHSFEFLCAPTLPPVQQPHGSESNGALSEALSARKSPSDRVQLTLAVRVRY